MDRTEFYRLLATDPYAAHAMILKDCGFDALVKWVKDASRLYKICLVIKPIRELDVGKWKCIARTYLCELLDNSAENVLNVYPDPQEVKGLHEKPFHCRRAHVCVRKRDGYTYYRGVSFPRLDKVKDDYDRRALTGAKGQYNARMRELAALGGKEFVMPVEWLKDRPELYDIWQRSISKRKEVVAVA